jgi:hypothetical protein
MKIQSIWQATGASVVALGLTVAPMSSIALAQDATTQEGSGTTTEMPEGETPDSAEQNFEDAGESLQEAGEETVEGVEATGEAVEQNAEEAAERAEAAAQRAEQATEEALSDIENRANWGWLGLVGLFGLFGLAGGNKGRSSDDAHYSPTTREHTGTYR